MDFDFSSEQCAFEQEVIRFLDDNDDPDVFDVTRENMAQIVDTPKRRAFMRKLGERGWLGLTWPKELAAPRAKGSTSTSSTSSSRRAAGRRSARASASSARRSSKRPASR
jgi:alkylation response protein AidB-like acyl-CoA dehydrogenase